MVGNPWCHSRSCTGEKIYRIVTVVYLLLLCDVINGQLAGCLQTVGRLGFAATNSGDMWRLRPQEKQVEFQCGQLDTQWLATQRRQGVWATALVAGLAVVVRGFDG